MPRGNFEPEIKTAMADSPLGRVNKTPPKQSPSAVAKQPPVAKAAPQSSPQGPPQVMSPDATGPTAGGMPPLPHQVAAATSIAHAILGKRGLA